jgi:nucleoside-diphosphate-sugar epimerase
LVQPFQGWWILDWRLRVAPAAEPWAGGLERRWRSQEMAGRVFTMNKESNSKAPPTLVALGGGGFVGARLTQLAALSGRFKAVPILRSYRGLARLGVAVPDACVTDTQDLDALTKAFHGCKTVVNLTMGDQLRILEDTQLIYAACVKAGVAQLIHMSSAVVFGRVEDPTINDDSPPDTRSWMLYARGKANAEIWLGEKMGNGPVQVVVLRPGLIWGPGSNWAEMVGDQLLHGSAVLSNGGKGIANLIFVDNLVRIILAVASRLSGPSGIYNVADNETITWQRYYTELATRLGYSSEVVSLWPDSRFRLKPRHAVEWALEQPVLFGLAKRVLKRLGPRAKAVLKAKLKGAPEPPGGVAGPPGPPILSRGHWVLQNTVHRLPAMKIQRDFGPVVLIPHEEAMETTAAWLKFAGFAAPANVPGPSHALPKV